MQCESCGQKDCIHADTCTNCGAARGSGGGTGEGGTRRVPDEHPPVTDGGTPPDDDETDPLADPDEGETEESVDEKTVLEPDDIVGDDLDEQPSTGQSPTDEQPPAGEQPASEPSATEPADSDHPPAGDEPTDEQPPAGGESTHDEPSAGEEPVDSQRAGQPGQPAGQPKTGQPGQPAGQPKAGQPGQPAGQPKTGQPGQPGQPAGQPEAGQPSQAAGQPSQAAGQPGQPAGQHPGAQSTGNDIVAQIKELPLLLGGVLGAVAVLVPYAILAALSFVTNEQTVIVAQDGNRETIAGADSGVIVPNEMPVTAADPAVSRLGSFDVAAELLFEFLQFGSGERIRDLFLTAADTELAAVDPVDYPNWEQELGPLLSMLDSAPEAPLFILYVLAPYGLFVSARYLARHYTPGETLFDHVKAGLTVTVGTFPFLLAVGLIFTVTSTLGPILLGGVVIPAAIGTLGGLTVYWFDDPSPLQSKIFGLVAVLAGLAIAFALVPTPDVGMGGGFEFSTVERFFIGLAGYLGTMQLDIGSGTEGTLLFFGVLVVTIGAGFLRTWTVRERVADETEGARIGSTIFLGFVGAMVLLLWVFPMSIIFVDFSAGLDQVATAYFDEIMSGVGDYLWGIVIAGAGVPMALGAFGGYLAIWYRDRDKQPQQGQQQYSQPRQ